MLAVQMLQHSCLRDPSILDIAPLTYANTQVGREGKGRRQYFSDADGDNDR